MVKLVLIIFSFLMALSANSQSKTSKPALKVKFSSSNSRELFLDRLNLVGVEIVPETNDSLTISVSQGNFSLFDSTLDNIYLVQAVQLGDLNVSVLRIKDGKAEVIGRKLFKVVLSEEQKTLNKLSTKPNIGLGAVHSGQIPIDTIRKINCLTINDRYKLIAATVYFSGSTGTSCVTTTSLNSNCFDVSFRKYWDRLMPGSIITFDRIEVQDNINLRKYILPSISFMITNNKAE